MFSVKRVDIISNTAIMRSSFALFFASVLFSVTLFAEEKIGVRPYEMVNANRTMDTHPPLVDFENLEGWTAETVESEVEFTPSREQQLWGEHVGKLTYKNVPTEKKTPTVTLKPPKPIAIGKEFDCVNLWMYGNNWAWAPNPQTPQVAVTILLQGSTMKPLRLHLGTVNWTEWFLLHKKLSPEQIASLGDAPCFEGIEIRGGTNKEPRTLFFDNLSFYKEELKPLTFEPRPKQPFPNREETILPTSGTATSRSRHCQYDIENKDRFFLICEEDDGNLTWEYTPRTGTLSDLHVSWRKRPLLQRIQLRGECFRFVDEPKVPPKMISTTWSNDCITACWKFGDNEVEYRFRIKGKTLMVDVRCPGGNVKEFSSGGWNFDDESKEPGTEAVLSRSPRTKLVKVPYLVGNGPLRPAVVVAETKPNPLFILSMLDHTRSNASEFFFENKIEKDYVSGAACSRYNPKTDGKRNDFYERLFITVSPTFEEVLPNIPNDKSPWKSVTAERVWRAHGASNHDRDYEYWSRVKRYGMEKMLITDHETLWRDGGESFTFRTYAAPGKGGDEGQKEYTRKMHELGFIYGPYNNYTDYAPVNAFWNEDWVTRLSDGNYQSAWARCYNPKPAAAVQAESKIAEIVQKKFGFNTAYCDVHTAVQPWRYVDYDARVPGAGTFAATFYAYGEIMLHQKKTWNGPVYSEGNNHWFYSGLTDGNYGQDQSYFVHENGLPWIVDFDLLKMHPLENNFGMGNLGMFYGKEQFKDAREKGYALDRFLAATLAFGHTGFLAMEFGLDGGARSYFTIQQIAARYGTQNVKSIRYADESGKLLTTSEAIASDAVKLNRIRVEYEDGLMIYVNGNPTEPWEIVNSHKGTKVTKEETPASSPFVPSCLCEKKLPPNGWCVVDPKKELSAWSLDIDGSRTDYVDSPSYLFADVRDNPKGKPRRFDRLLCDRQLIVRKNIDDKGRWEMIVGEPNYPGRSTLHAVRLDNDADADVITLDFHRKELGPATTKYSRGMVHIEPVDGAFSYILTPKAKPTNIVTADRTRAVSGETVELNQDGTKTQGRIPVGWTANSLYWMEFPDGSRIDFDIVPLCDFATSLNEAGNQIDITVRSNIFRKMPGGVAIRLGDEPKEPYPAPSPFGTEQPQAVFNKPVDFVPGKSFSVSFSIDRPAKPQILPLLLLVSTHDAFVAGFTKNYWLKTDFAFPELASIPDRFETGYCYRKGEPTAMDGKSGAYVHIETVSCGDGTRKAWAIHPPYMGGTGYAFMLSEPVAVPDLPGIAFFSEVGIRNGGDKSDGVLYRVFVLEDGKDEKLAGEINWAEHRWTPLVCDLSPWRGKTVRFRLVADVGPNDNSSADWAAWSEIRLVSTEPQLRTTLHETPVELTFVFPTDFTPPMEPIRSVEDFVKATKVELVYDGCGMDASDRYHSTATLNGVPLGRLPGAGGDETKGVWQTVSLPIPQETAATLKFVNRLEIVSAEDHFKIRRFRLVATFSDGSQRSTAITSRTTTHPGSWKYAEGESAPLGKPIPVDIIIGR